MLSDRHADLYREVRRKTRRPSRVGSRCRGPTWFGAFVDTSTRAAHLWDALCRVYDVLGFDQATGGDEVFGQLVCARIIEPTSKQDSVRVLDETGVAGPWYPTLNRRLSVFANASFRQALSKACADHGALGPRLWCFTT